MKRLIAEMADNFIKLGAHAMKLEAECAAWRLKACRARGKLRMVADLDGGMANVKEALAILADK